MFYSLSLSLSLFTLFLKETAVAAILPFIDLIEELVGTPTSDRYPWRLFIDDVSGLK